MAVDPSLLGNPAGYSGDPNSLTLFNYARESNSPMVKATIRSIYLTGNVMQDIPWDTQKSMWRNGERFDGSQMPRVDFVPLSQDFPGTNAEPSPYAERIYRVGNLMDEDVIYSEDENRIPGMVQAKMDLYMDSLAIKVNDYFINNNHVTGDRNAPIGLKARLADTRYRIPSDLVKQSTADISDSSSNVGQNSAKLGRDIDNLFTALNNPGGNKCVIYGAGIGLNQWSYALKLTPGGGGWSVNQSNYDQQVEKYRGAKLMDLGRKIDMSSPVISVTEDANGNEVGNGNYTSIYVVRYGQPYFSGWQFQTPTWTPAKKIDNEVTMRRSFRWEMGYWVPNTRSIARIYGIKIK